MRIEDFYNAEAIALNYQQSTLGTDGFLGEGFFPSDRVPGIDLKTITGYRGLPVSLAASTFDAKPPLRNRAAITTTQQKMPFFREEMLVTEQDKLDMLEYENIESRVADLLQNFLSEQGYNCPVVLANTAGKIPPYPYISFTVIEPLVSDIDHYIETRDGSKYKVIPQRWSFTVQSSDEFESGKIALMAYDYFDDAGTYDLEDIGVTVRDVGNITTRDNFISSEYEYRKGFDATFMVANIIDKSMYSKLGLIESETITLSVNGSEEQIITINKE